MVWGIMLYALIGLCVSLRAEYLFGSRDHAVNTMIDVALWPVMVFYWAVHGGK